MITLEDKRGNLLQGNIIVTDKNKLINFRNQLLQETYEGKDANFEIIMPKRRLVCFDNETGEGVYSKNGLLVKQSNFVADYREDNSWVFDYDKEIIACKHLNTINLLSSLLDIPNRYYNSKIATEFFNAGIFNCSNFYETWQLCRNNLLQDENVNDLEMFRDAFVYGGIAYHVQDSWLHEDVIRMNVLKTLGLNLNELTMNTKIMGVDKILRRSK